ncbi:MAG: Omp28-related outer membrane protein [Sedimentisphaerales bacterium]
MNKLSTLLLAIAIVALMTAGTNAQIKNVLLEQHTGAWCGWCVDGTVVMDEILELYGDQVIGVKIHSGDAMEIPEQSVIGGALGLPGYPTGSIDRKNFGGSVFLSRGSWKASCESQIQQKAKAEVDCFFTLDKDTRIVKIQVMANIVEPMDFPLRFNAYIVEDDVTGVGSGYDQKNYLSGRAGFEDNPYYDQPSTIVGYHHMKVVRKMLGGAWGVAIDLPESVQAGEFYSYQFVSEIDEAWKIDDVYFVGMLQADAEDNKEIINSAYATEDVLLIDSNAPTTKAVPPVSDFNNVYTLVNPTDQDQTYTVTVSTTGRTPADWSAEFSCGVTELTTADINDTVGQIVVPANSSAELLLTLNVGATLGFGDAKIVLVMEGTPTIRRTRMITGLTSEIEKLLLETGSGYSIWPYLEHADHNDIIILDPGEYMAFAGEMTNLKLVIWNKGPSGGLSADEIDVIKNTEDVNHFICGDGVISSLVYPDNLSYFGLEWIGWNLEALGPTGTVWFSGQQGDAITGNLGGNIEGCLMMYYVNMVRINDADNVSPIMHFQNNGFRRFNNNSIFITANDTVFGVRITKDSARTVLLGISPYIIADENIRQTLISNILDWLAGDTGAEN